MNPEKDLLHEFKELEQLIKDQERLAKRIESIIIESPDLQELPKELEALHPKSLYAMTVRSIAILRIKRLDLLLSFTSTEKLSVLLSRAIQEEDFETAAKLRDEIERLQQKISE